MVAHDHAQPQPLGAAFRRLDDAAGLLESVTCFTAVGCVDASYRCTIFPNKRQADVGSRTASPRSIHSQGRATGYRSSGPYAGKVVFSMRFGRNRRTVTVRRGHAASLHWRKRQDQNQAECPVDAQAIAAHSASLFRLARNAVDLLDRLHEVVELGG